MATVSRGLTFGASETVTNTKLHNLVDDATVTQIVNSDIDAAAAIADTKLDDITTGNKVGGTALFGLASIPSGAGIIPQENLPDSISDFTTINVGSLASIAQANIPDLDVNTNLDSVNFINTSLASIADIHIASDLTYGTTNQGDILYDNGTSIVRLTPGTDGHWLKTQGAGANPVWEANDPGTTFVSKTTVNNASNSGDITIEEDKTYLVVAELNADAGGVTPTLLFNSDSTGTRYAWTNTRRTFATTPTVTNLGDGSDGSINMTGDTIDNGETAFIRFYIHTTGDGTNSAWVSGQFVAAGVNRGGEFYGVYKHNTTLTSFEIDTALNCDFVITVTEIKQS